MNQFYSLCLKKKGAIIYIKSDFTLKKFFFQLFGGKEARKRNSGLTGPEFLHGYEEGLADTHPDFSRSTASHLGPTKAHLAL